MKKVVVTVTNDLSTDQRVQRAIAVWQELGYAPTFVGRRLLDSKPFNPSYSTKRFKLIFKGGFLFYATYNLRLMVYLLTNRFDVYQPNDLDTLLPNYLASRLFGKPLVYDSHEYFCGAPEIANRPLVKGVWLKLEKTIFPRLKTIITVNTSIARLYAKEYGKKLLVVRNIGDSFLPSTPSRKELNLPANKFILINQGAGINIDRGMEEMLAALLLLPADVVLLIVGKGDVLPQLKKQAAALDLNERVIFVPPQPYQKLLQYTLCADAGLSLDKDTNLNYRYSLPNKVFDYIKCGLPIVCSSVVEVRELIKHYQIGEVTGHAPEQISQAILKVRAQGKVAYKNQLNKAAAENNWEQERQVLVKAFTALN
jgi:glycosyltransferase involved in cell wall biosynthesis